MRWTFDARGKRKKSETSSSSIDGRKNIKKGKTQEEMGREADLSCSAIGEFGMEKASQERKDERQDEKIRD